MGRRPAEAVQLVELSGRGGPFQHAVALAGALTRAGVPVVLHTATDAELASPDGVVVCRCMDWLRGVRRARSARLATRYLTRTAPHLVAAGRGGVLHMHGPFLAGLSATTLAVARAAGARVVYSPHNTFSRAGRSRDLAVIRLAARVSHATVVFSAADAAVVRGWHARPVVSFLLQLVPSPDPAAVAGWRSRWGAGPVVLFAGQIRTDKRLDVLVEASVRWHGARRLAVVGSDRGDQARCRRRAAEVHADVDWAVDYHSLDSFVAAIEAADAVVCCYSRGSQSGVLAVARQLGTPAIASDVGGLAELASATVAADAGPQEVATAVDDLLAAPPPLAPISAEAITVAAHRDAYAL